MLVNLRTSPSSYCQSLIGSATLFFPYSSQSARVYLSCSPRHSPLFNIQWHFSWLPSCHSFTPEFLELFNRWSGRTNRTRTNSCLWHPASPLPTHFALAEWGFCFVLFFIRETFLNAASYCFNAKKIMHCIFPLTLMEILL